MIEWQCNTRETHCTNLVTLAGAPRWPPQRDSNPSLLGNAPLSPTTHVILDSRNQAYVNPAHIVRHLTWSEFCLQPRGDSPTRKLVFDSLVLGCIPIVFDPFTAHHQYPRHLHEDDRTISVYIHTDEAKMLEVNVIERLMKIPIK